MAAPFKNKNALKYSRMKAIELLSIGILSVQNDKTIFNYPALSKAYIKVNPRVFAYLEQKFQNDPEIMTLWSELKLGLAMNLEFHLNSLV